MFIKKRIQSLLKKNKSKSQVDALDGLRGIAVLIVLISHMSNLGLHIQPLFNFTGIGKAGVYLFFILSFFLLTSILLRVEMSKILTFSFLKEYFIRRFMRVYPLFIIVIIASYFFTKFTEIDCFIPIRSIRELLNHLFLRQGNHLFWTIAVEFKYYFVLPGIVLFIKPFLTLDKKKVYYLYSLLSLIYIPLIIKVLDFYAPKTRMSPYAVIFFCGAFIALLNHLYLMTAASVSGKFKNIFEVLAWSGLCAIFLTIPSLWSFLARVDLVQERFHSSYLMYSVLWATVLWGCLHGNGLIMKFFELKFLRLVGIVSFSLYLCHMPILYSVNALDLPAPMKWILVVVFVFPTCCASYLFIEKPFMQFGRHKRT